MNFDFHFFLINFYIFEMVSKMFYGSKTKNKHYFWLLNTFDESLNRRETFKLAKTYEYTVWERALWDLHGISS